MVDDLLFFIQYHYVIIEPIKEIHQYKLKVVGVI